MRAPLWGADDVARSPESEQVIRRHQEDARSWEASLNPAELKAVRGYVGMEYMAINAGLRVGLVDDLVPVLDSALAKAPRSEPVVRYRGVGFYGKDVQSYIDEHLVVGSQVTFPSYLSTSDDPVSAALFALGKTDCFVMEILTDKGAAVSNDNQMDEFERLLPRGMTFEVVEAREDIEFCGDYQNVDETITVVRLREVGLSLDR